MGHTINFLLVFCFLATVHQVYSNISNNGCQIDTDTAVWQAPVFVEVLDTHRGSYFDRATQNVEGFTVQLGEGLNYGGSYVDVTHENSRLVLSTNNAYESYEENETSNIISITLTFTCSGGGTTLPLTFRISVTDTNNNAPAFVPGAAFEFTLAPPVPPGFLLTDCVRDMLARDIDLTTQRIIFDIEENPYLVIAYDEEGSTTAKEFKATLRTASLIRALAEPVTLTISATDVDETGDPPLTTYATVTITGDSEFELPAEPVFTRAYYLANYSLDGQLALDQPISLQQGYDDQVQFTLEGALADEYFELATDGNEVVISVLSPLPGALLAAGPLLLAVHALRSYTSGASATVVVQLPQAVGLEFERPNYEGQIVDNTLQLTELILSAGYQDSVVAVVVEDYPTYFTASVAGNAITLSMAPLADDIIEENNVINLRVTASTEVSSATAVVTLEVVKQDSATPVFERGLYRGAYLPPAALALEPLLLVQGYDQTVSVTLSGDHADYFVLTADEASITLSVAEGGLPAPVLAETRLLLTVEAAKPRTVGARAVVSIDLPAARELQFEAASYSGSLQDGALLLETIVLSAGYDDDVNFTLTGDYATSFAVSNAENQVTINLSTQLPQDVLSENNFIILSLAASGVNALPATTTVLLEIIKDDVTTPVFSQPIYYGTYLGSLDIDIDNINLAQGLDDSVTFALKGENAEYFQISQNADNSIALALVSAIPEEVIFDEKMFVFSIVASKPRTVGAHAAVAVRFSNQLTEPALMHFERNGYIGTLEENLLTLENIILETGFTADVEFILSGEFAQYFAISWTNNIVSVSLVSELPVEIVNDDRFIMLEVEGRRARATPAAAAVLVHVVDGRRDAAEPPVFAEPYYTGLYTEDNVLQFEQAMTLTQGYDESVTFQLEGESSTWFALVQTGNSITLTAATDIPEDVLQSSDHLLFAVLASKPDTIGGRTAIAIQLPRVAEQEILRFSQTSYEGQISGSELQAPTITLENENIESIQLEITGAHAEYFTISLESNAIQISLDNSLPEIVVANNNFIILDITASKEGAVNDSTVLVLRIIKDTESQVITPVFEQAYYLGEYSEQGGLLFDSTIRLIQGFDESVSFSLEGDDSQWFTINENQENSLTLSITNEGIPETDASSLIFSIQADKPGSISGQATMVISLTDYSDNAAILGFERVSYLGSLENNVATLEPITLSEGYTSEVVFTLLGDLSNYFSLQQQDSSVNIVLQSAIPEQSLPANNIVLMELRASAPQAISAFTTVVFEVVREEDSSVVDDLVLSATYYTGQYTEAAGLVFETAITLDEGYDENVQFTLEGDQSQWFSLNVEGNSATLILSNAIPAAILANNQQLVFVVNAQKPGSSAARATIVISLEDDYNDNSAILGFERVSYLGSLENNVATLEPITLSEGYTSEVVFTLLGDLSNYFSLQQQDSSVNIVLQSAIPEQSLPANNIVLMELRASAPQAISAFTTVVFEVVREEDSDVAYELVFSAAYYTGQYNEDENLIFEDTISLYAGFDDNVRFTLEGESSEWFELIGTENSMTIALRGVIPAEVTATTRKMLFVVSAQKPNSNIARATIVISIFTDSGSEPGESFDKVLYEGIIQLNSVQHEPIFVSGYEGTNIEIFGEYGALFTGSVSESTGAVSVSAAGEAGEAGEAGQAGLALPEGAVFAALELRAGAASAVLVLRVDASETPAPPTVSFEAASYALRAAAAQSGPLGRVRAAADNGERLNYALLIDNVHLQERIWINSDGEIHLSAAADTGVYGFLVTATTVVTQATASAPVQLTVDAVSTCGEDELVLPPLIIIDRDEESEHRNLVVLDSAEHEGCRYSLANRWPAEQDWLYVDESGLHARAIDREHESIAFMAQSQVQVELVLECDADAGSRTKRSVNADSRLDWLGPYDYGTNRWILTDTILYNPRRSYVNLIVNDINDNYPIFVGKELEPVVVGYPTPALVDVVLPRALAQLQATDADIGENAALMYWSTEPELAVAPRAGSVHVRDGAALRQDALLTVLATDRAGAADGLTASIQLMVKLIDASHIAVITVRNAFLDQEESILSELSAAVGYEVKILRAAVISHDAEPNSRNVRDKREAILADGASLQLYVYGVVDREPVAVDRLTNDINNYTISAVDIAGTVSLEDHLEGREIGGPGRDTGLLVATIVLSVLLFILIVAIAVWFFLKWRKERNYDKFSDENSVASRSESLGRPAKLDSLKKPRLNIEELKRSERRLQEMLEAPVDGASSSAPRDPVGDPVRGPVDPVRGPARGPVRDTVLDLAPADSALPIVIQSIDKLKDDDDDDDEFGEIKNKLRRKSVVTFNENVEKIIHVEDIPDDSSEVEVFKF